MANATLLYVHDRDYFYAETFGDELYLDGCEYERLAAVDRWRAEHARRQAVRTMKAGANMKFNTIAAALARKGN